MEDKFLDLRTTFDKFQIKYKLSEPLAVHTTFRIGGPADAAVFPSNAEELGVIISEARRLGIRYTVIGGGSNILCADAGYRGLVIFTSEMKNISFDGNIMRADCGAKCVSMATEAKKKGLSGLEFSYGIPGSCGGCVFMNAGAFGGQFSDILLKVECYDANVGQTVSISAAELEMSYRSTIFMRRPELTVISAELGLCEKPEAEIDEAMKYNLGQRRAKQPVEFPSAGSVFKRHGEFFAGKVIEDSGLKGYTVGGAQVSEKHAGFIINRGATAEDVLRLIDHINEVIFKNYGFTLETEIRYVN